jgi:hypothetical protein
MGAAMERAEIARDDTNGHDDDDRGGCPREQHAG